MLKIQQSFSPADKCIYIRLYDGMRVIVEKSFYSYDEAIAFSKELEKEYNI